MEYFYKTLTPHDELLCGPSGLGYNYFSQWARRRTDTDNPCTSRVEYLQRTDKLMRQLDFHAMWPINRIIEWLPDGRMLTRIAGDDVFVAPPVLEARRSSATQMMVSTSDGLACDII